ADRGRGAALRTARPTPLDVRAAVRQERGRGHARDDGEPRPVVRDVTQLVGQLLPAGPAVSEPLGEHSRDLADLARAPEGELEQLAVLGPTGVPRRSRLAGPGRVVAERH